MYTHVSKKILKKDEDSWRDRKTDCGSEEDRVRGEEERSCEVISF